MKKNFLLLSIALFSVVGLAVAETSTTVSTGDVQATQQTPPANPTVQTPLPADPKSVGKLDQVLTTPPVDTGSSNSSATNSDASKTAATNTGTPAPDLKNAPTTPANGTTAPTQTPEAAKADARWFGGLRDSISTNSDSLQAWCKDNPKLVVTLAVGTAVIATALVIAKSKTVQSLLGIETAEDDEEFVF